MKIFCPYQFEKDPFPDIYKQQLDTALSSVNNALLQKFIVPWGNVRDMILDYDFENFMEFSNSFYHGMSHHTGVNYAV